MGILNTIPVMKPRGFKAGLFSHSALPVGNSYMTVPAPTTPSWAKYSVFGWVKRSTLPQTPILATYDSASRFHKFETNGNGEFRLYGLRSGVDYGLTWLIPQRDYADWVFYLLHVDLANAVQDDRHTLYLDGEVITNAKFTHTWGAWPQNWAGDLNNGREMRIGYEQNSGFYSDDYHCYRGLADGVLLDPALFIKDYKKNGNIGEPLKPDLTGMLGPNGFLYGDGGALGIDSSGNNRHATVVGTIYPLGQPTTGPCQLNTFDKDTALAISSLGEINTRATMNTTNSGFARGTLGVSSGVWYWEYKGHSGMNAPDNFGITGGASNPDIASGQHATDYSFWANGAFWNNNTSEVYGSNWQTLYPVNGVRLDLDSNTIEFFVNGTSQGIKTIAAGTYYPVMGFNGTATRDAELYFQASNWTQTPAGITAANAISIENGAVYNPAFVKGVDSPSDTACTWNPLGSHPNVILTEGNTSVTSTAGGAWVNSSSTMPFPVGQGQWYAEFEHTVLGSSGYSQVGITPVSVVTSDNFTAGANLPASSRTDSYTIYNADDGTAVLGTGTNSTVTDLDTPMVGNIWRIAFNAATGDLWLGNNNSWWGGGDPALGTSPTHSGLSTTEAYVFCSSNIYYTTPVHHKARFAEGDWTYAAPEGFLSLRTSNLPKVEYQGSDYTHTSTRIGTGAPVSISDKPFSPDYVHTKGMTVGYSHGIFDIKRGALSKLSTDNTVGVVSSGLTSFDPFGFSLDSDAGLNQLNATYSDVCLKQGPHFQIVRYQGTPDAQDIPIPDEGNLGSEHPWTLGWIKSDEAENWPVFSAFVGNQKVLFLNLPNAASGSSPTYWNSKSPTHNQFSVGTDNAMNEDGVWFTAFWFRTVAGLSHVGLTKGNGNAKGPLALTGGQFEFLLRKNINASQWWPYYTTALSPTNPVDQQLYMNDTAIGDADGLGNLTLDNNTGGFNIVSATGGTINAADQWYIHLALLGAASGGKNQPPL